jgi:hypothetical protein
MARWEAFGIGERYHCYYPTFSLSGVDLPLSHGISYEI